MSDVLIALRNVSKDYESGAGLVRALRDVDLAIDKGDFVAIVGASGSGKSTLMNILGCLDRPTRGTYELAGFDVGSRSSDARAILRNRLIGFIFQGFNLLARTTALENVELPLVYRGVSAKERRQRALAALEAVGLGDRTHHTPNQLSGGQQQRVAIARALVTDPPMLLADEPTGNLDTRTSHEVLALLQRLNRERGITICIVTHEHDIAACASRVVTFRDGRIQSDIRNETPVDAASDLHKLPPPDLALPPDQEDQRDPAVLQKKRLGGPVPKVLYGVMLAAGIFGIVLGNLYSKVVLGFPTGLPPLLFAFFLEALSAEWYARRKLGRALTSDQRVRVALTYSIGSTCLLAIQVALGIVPFADPVLDRLASLSPRGIGAALAIVLLGLAATSLARYLLLALSAWFVPPPKTRGAHRA